VEINFAIMPAKMHDYINSILSTEVDDFSSDGIPENENANFVPALRTKYIVLYVISSPDVCLTFL